LVLKHFSSFRYLKTKLAQQEQDNLIIEQQKTDRILSLALPKSVVAKLRTVGHNYDLISERIQRSSVLFLDITNWDSIVNKELAGDIRRGVVVMNKIWEGMDDVIANHSELEKIKVRI